MNWVFIGIGIVVFISYAIFLFQRSKETPAFIERNDIELHKFLKTADRVQVVLDNAKIQQRNHYYTKTIVTGQAAALNEITGNGHHNEEIIASSDCEVTFKVRYKKRLLTYTETISKDEDSIRIHFYMKKSTVIFINPKDPKEYHLDLTFLDT